MTVLGAYYSLIWLVQGLLESISLSLHSFRGHANKKAAKLTFKFGRAQVDVATVYHFMAAVMSLNRLQAAM